MVIRFVKLVVAAALVSIVASAPTFAQQEGLSVTTDELRSIRRAQGDTMAFCVNSTSMLAPFERQVASEIAAALFLNLELVEVEPYVHTQAYDFRLPLEETEIFRLLARRCDAILGFTLLAEWPEWMSPSPPYLTTHTVMAVREDGAATAAAIPGKTPVGTRMMSMADSYMFNYSRVLPEPERWTRMVYPNNQFLMQRLLDRSVDAVLIWEPAVLAYRVEHPEAAGVRIISNLPFSVAPTEFVLALRPQEDFVNAAITEAIATLRAEGTFDRLAAEHGLVSAADQ